MVRVISYEMACVIYECARVLKPNAPFIMVNDNVRYAGVSVSVDLILSHMAEALGFGLRIFLCYLTEKVTVASKWVNMGEKFYERVYMWRKI